MTLSVTPELSRRVSLDRLPASLMVEASASECAALAHRLQIPAVRSVSCQFTLRKQGTLIEAWGILGACVIQECIISLEPLEQRIDERFSVRFVLDDQISEDDDPEAPDEIAYAGNSIDLGEAVAEQLALALDPYPRDPAAELDRSALEDDPGPFAGLAAFPALPRRSN